MKRSLQIGTTILASATVCASTAYARTNIRVAVSSASLFYASAYVAHDLGYFKQEGLNAKIVDVGSGSNVIASVVGGSAQIGSGSVLNIAHGIAHGQDLTGFATSLRGFPLFIVAQKSLMQKDHVSEGTPYAKRVAMLKGKSIAVNDIGGSAGDFVRQALKLGGMSPKSATLIDISSAPGRLAALKAGKIAALGGYPPGPEVALVKGYGQILVNAAKDMPATQNIEYILYFSPSSYIKKHPTVIKEYTKAIAKASKLMKDQPAVARKAFFDAMKSKAAGVTIDPKLQEQEWKDMSSYYVGNIAIIPKDLAKSRIFFRVPKSVSNNVLVDMSIAKGY